MLKYLIPICITYLILVIICVILIVKEAKKTNNKEDITLIIISFLVPFVGLIVYAINVGKDKHIVDCALKGLKMLLKLIVAEIIISIVIFALIFVLDTHKEKVSSYMKKIDTPSNNVNDEIPINNKNNTTQNEKLSLEEIKQKVSNKYQGFTSIQEKEKGIYFKMVIDSDNTIDKAKEIGEFTLKYLNESYSNYVYYFTISSKEFIIIGYSDDGKEIIWTSTIEH